jgi:asparagine synthase (glutamine-hydrolysing)
MTGFCGWIGGGGRDDAASVLAAMAAGLPDLDVAVCATHVGPVASLALRGRSREGGWHQEGDLLAAIQGYPRWTDPELAALARAYKANGKGLLAKLRGAFAIAVLDGTTKKALLAIDRFGIQPLCYALRGDGTLLFGGRRSHGVR